MFIAYETLKETRSEDLDKAVCDFINFGSDEGGTWQPFGNLVVLYDHVSGESTYIQTMVKISNE